MRKIGWNYQTVLMNPWACCISEGGSKKARVFLTNEGLPAGWDFGKIKAVERHLPHTKSVSWLGIGNTWFIWMWLAQLRFRRQSQRRQRYSEVRTHHSTTDYQERWLMAVQVVWCHVNWARLLVLICDPLESTISNQIRLGRKKGWRDNKCKKGQSSLSEVSSSYHKKLATGSKTTANYRRSQENHLSFTGQAGMDWFVQP